MPSLGSDITSSVAAKLYSDVLVEVACFYLESEPLSGESELYLDSCHADSVSLVKFKLFGDRLLRFQIWL